MKFLTRIKNYFFPKKKLVPNIKWRKWLPNIYLRINLPFIRIETTILYERMATMGVEWTGLDIRVWKYSFSFQWYWKPV